MTIFIIVTTIILFFLVLVGYNAFENYKWHKSNLGKNTKLKPNISTFTLSTITLMIHDYLNLEGEDIPLTLPDLE